MAARGVRGKPPRKTSVRSAGGSSGGIDAPEASTHRTRRTGEGALLLLLLPQAACRRSFFLRHVGGDGIFSL